ncbi:MAG: PSD1 and planctomycete cytochrome C domain-containing protein [Acidobacteriia bacterium]|nr:PSD1 and planctomycete cytochrome C domain-containing protein [Terriglobia bacterium]
MKPTLLIELTRGKLALPLRGGLAILFAAGLATAQPANTEFFEQKIRPLLVAHCFACHGDKSPRMGGLNLSTAEGFYKGAASGPIFSKENPETSHILGVIGYQGEIKMPPGGKLSDAEINDITTWVKMGAPWPGASQVPVPGRSAGAPAVAKSAEKPWWAKPPRKPATPPVRNSAWVRNDVDNFILAKLEANGLTPASPASKVVLLRRATYDLTGLPPTAKELQDFLADHSPDAFAHVVDRLISTPQYGERWGRHWLDVARYADSNGLTNDRLYPNAWRYRDYVIDAFNHDMPYNHFVMEQIAGDMLPAGSGGEVNKNGLIATGFLAIGSKPFVEKDKTKMVYDTIDEQIDVTSKAFMGVTVSCARCHDHKFDPISTKDYYSMAAIFAATRSFGQVEDPSRPYQGPLVPEGVYEAYEQYQQKIAAKQREINGLTDRAIEAHREKLRPQLAGYMTAAWHVAKNEPLETVSKQAGLDPAILKTWVEYFQGTGPGAGQRPYLEEWRQASAERIQAVTSAYEARYDAAARRWKQQLADWDKEVDATLAKGLAPVARSPFKPESTDDRFFGDVGFGDGPFGLPERGAEKFLPAEVKQQLAESRKQLDSLRKNAPPEPPMATAVAEGQPVLQHVFLRGDHKNVGAEVSRAFPRVLAGDNQPSIQTGSGRLELAKWLAQADNPVTARVMVNRIWQWHFGEGLVRTPNNFGKQGEPPTHPELLDYLAVRFVESGWSVKAITRLIMLSSAYQMSSTATPLGQKNDPQDLLWSRFSRRRLDIEEIRDSMLALDGSLDLTMGGTLIAPRGAAGATEPGATNRDPMQSTRRTVYLPVQRANLLPLLTLFDFGDAATSSAGRSHTNVAPQALFMMNSEFVDERAKRLAQKLLAEARTPSEFVARAYLTVFDREPAGDELAEALQYLTEAPARLAANASEDEKRLRAAQSLTRILLSSNEFLYVD